jgi:acyl carrier protein
MMTKREFLSELEEILETDPGALKGDERLTDLKGWNSLAVVSLIAMVDERLDTTLSPREIAKAGSIADIVRLLGDTIVP